MPHNGLMEARTPRITVVGSLNQDITVTVSRFPEPGETLIGTSVSYRLGGKGANQAVAAARAGAEVWFVGRVGGDAAGLTLRQSLRDFGVRDELLAVDPGVPTGTAHITVDANGENEIIVVPGANGVVDLSGLREGHPARDADVFVTQGEVPPATVAAVAELGRARGAEVVLNLAPAIALPAAVFEGLGVLVVNESEAGLVLGEEAPASVDAALATASRLLGLGVRRAVITLGRLGAVFVVAGEAGTTSGHVPAPSAARVVDTTGAGDAAVGVLAAALATGLRFDACVAAGVRAGSAAVGYPGAASGYPAFSLAAEPT